MMALSAFVIASLDPTGLSPILQGALAAGLPMSFVLYHFAFHAFAGGRTPGKHLIGLRVVSTDGYPASVSQNLLRSLLWPVDVFVFVPVSLGLLVIVLSEKRQRLGDIVAGTLVIRDDEQREREDPFAGERWSLLTRRVLDLHPGAAAHLTGDDYEYLRELLAREDLPTDERRRLFRSTAKLYAERLDLTQALNKKPLPDPSVALKELYLFLRESREARA